MWYIHSLEHYLGMKRNEVQIHTTITQINLNMTLKKDDTSVSLHLYEMFSKPIETEMMTGH